MVTATPAIILPRSSASVFCLASFRRCDWRSCSTIFLLASVAATARRLGRRKLRAKPLATCTTWPRAPNLSMSSRSMTSMISSGLDLRGERQQRDVAGLLDGVGQTALARSTDAGDAARHDLAALGDEAVQHLDVFVIDVVDLLDAEAAHFLAPEILLLLGEHRLVATGGTLRCAAWSSSGFCHYLFSLCSLKTLPYCRGSAGCG